MHDNRRLYSKLVVKDIDEERREFVGVASTMATDRHDDVVLPEGAKYSLPVPLLWQHNHDDAVGEVVRAEVKDGQIHVVCRVAQVDAPAQLRERLNEAWARVKAGLVRGLSIGFIPLEWSFSEESDGYIFREWDWTELSLVTIPANQEATISVIRSLYHDTAREGALAPAGASRKTYVSLTRSEDKRMDIQEQIESFSEKAAQLRTEQEQLMRKAAGESRSLDADEGQRFDEIDDELEQVQRHLGRLRAMESETRKQAAPVDGERGADRIATKASGTRSIVVTERKAENGLAFAQYVRALYRLKEHPWAGMDELKAATEQGRIDKRILPMVTRAAVPAASTSNEEWAGSLVHESSVVADFVEFLRPQTIIGQIPGLRRVPDGVPIDIMTSGLNAAWVGEGQAKPLTRASFESRVLELYKVAAIVAVTQELLRKASLNADAMLRDELAAAIAYRLNADFIDPAITLQAGVRPASITNGATSQASTTAAQDLNYILGNIVGAELPLSQLVLVMSGLNAFALARLRDPLGNRIYPELSVTGGTIDGVPVVVSDHVGTNVVGLVANEIYLVDEGGLDISASDQASLEMADNPSSASMGGSSNAPVPAQLVSMWQTNSVAFRAERFMNWARRRPAAVAYVTGAIYTNELEPEDNGGGGDNGDNDG